MKRIETLEELYKNSKLLLPSDYPFIYQIEGYNGDKMIVSSDVIGKVIDPDEDEPNIEFEYPVPPDAPRYKGEGDPNWEKINIIQVEAVRSSSSKQLTNKIRQYRFSLEKFEFPSYFLNFNNVSYYEALGYKGYKSYVSKDTLGTFKDFMDEL